jgi:hypothetical protein
MTAISTRNRGLGLSNDENLIYILQNILNFVYKVNFPLYQTVVITVQQLDEVMTTNAIRITYSLDCRLQFATTDFLSLPTLREMNSVSLVALSDPAYLPLYQSSPDPILPNVFRTNATLYDSTSGGTTTGSTQSSTDKGTIPKQSVSPISSWTVTVIASAVATSAIVVIVFIFAMRRRAIQRSTCLSESMDDSLAPQSVAGRSYRTDDAQVLVQGSHMTLADQSTEYSLNSNMYTDNGYDAMSLMSATSDSKLGSVMDAASLDDSKNEYGRLSRNFSKVWNSDVESNRSLDEDSRGSPSRSLNQDSDDGQSLSYLQVYYGKNPSFTLELLGGVDRPKAVDDYSQSEVDVVSASEYAYENRSCQSSMYGDDQSELSSMQ